MRLRALILPTLAVLFAFGMGIALGAGPLHGIDAQTPTGPPTSHATADGRFPDAALGAVASTLYGDGLAGQSIAIVALPGASSSAVSALQGQIESAGGKIASTTTVQSRLTTASNKSLVESLGSQLDSQLPGIVGSGTSTYSRIGQLLGQAIATTALAPPTPAPNASAAPTPTVPTPTAPSTAPTTAPTSAPTTGSTSGPASTPGSPTPSPVDPAVAIATIRQSLSTAGLTSTISAGAPVAPMVVVVTGWRTDPSIVSGLVAGIAAKAHNVVATGRTRDSDLASLHTAKVAVATVDGDEFTAGRAAVVLALIKQLTSGSYGASGVDGPLPFG